jgi:sialidase-1
MLCLVFAVCFAEGKENLMRDKRMAPILPHKQESLLQESMARNLRIRKPYAVDIFKSGPDYTYRIPALIALDGGWQPDAQGGKDVILAFAERRMGTSRDTGDIDVVTRRSEDGGKSWSEENEICNFGRDVCGNPTVVEDSKGHVHLLLTRNSAENGEESGHPDRTVWVAKSSDQGRSWMAPRDITQDTKQASWKWYATGPGHGTRLQNQKDPNRNGRLVIPCDHSKNVDGQDIYSSHVLLSDDDGETWRVGGNIVEDSIDRSNEASLIERGDGTLLLNARNFVTNGRGSSARLLTGSQDGGASWSRELENLNLVTPDCEGSMHVLRRNKPAGSATALLQESSDADVDVDSGHEVILFSHPSTSDRQDLMLSLSNDGGQSWPSEKSVLLHQGNSGYSDLETLSDGTVLVLYETGYEGIRLQSLIPALL